MLQLRARSERTAEDSKKQGHGSKIRQRIRKQEQLQEENVKVKSVINSTGFL